MIKLLVLIYIAEEYIFTLDKLLEDLSYYNVWNRKIKPLDIIGKKYTLQDLLKLIHPKTQHKEVDF